LGNVLTASVVIAFVDILLNFNWEVWGSKVDENIIKRRAARKEKDIHWRIIILEISFL
jgi:hypothetical protein